MGPAPRRRFSTRRTPTIFPNHFFFRAYALYFAFVFPQYYFLFRSLTGAPLPTPSSWARATSGAVSRTLDQLSRRHKSVGHRPLLRPNVAILYSSYPRTLLPFALQRYWFKRQQPRQCFTAMGIFLPLFHNIIKRKNILIDCTRVLILAAKTSTR